MTHNAHAPYLFETPGGSVLHCPCCGRMQIVFDGLTLLVQRSCFEQLQPEVAQAGAIRRGAEGGWFRLVVPTDVGRVTVPMSARKITALQTLLGGAQAMLDLEDHLQTVATGAGAAP